MAAETDRCVDKLRAAGMALEMAKTLLSEAAGLCYQSEVEHLRALAARSVHLYNDVDRAKERVRRPYRKFLDSYAERREREIEEGA